MTVRAIVRDSRLQLGLTRQEGNGYLGGQEEFGVGFERKRSSRITRGVQCAEGPVRNEAQKKVSHCAFHNGQTGVEPCGWPEAWAWMMLLT